MRKSKGYIHVAPEFCSRGGPGGAQGRAESTYNFEASVWRSEPVGKQGVEGSPEAGLVQMPRGGQCQPLPTTLPLAMEERARVDIIFY